MDQPRFDRRRAALLALAAAAWPSLTRANLATPFMLAPQAPLLAPEPGAAAVATLRDLYRRMTAPVWINGQGPFAFVVDTGANRSVISAELAAQLGLTEGPSEPLNDAGGVEMARTVVVDLRVGGRGETQLTLSVLPASTVGGDGMLGVDRLAGERLTLDFHDQVLRIESSGRAAHDPLDVVVRAHHRDGQLTLVGADLGGAPVTAFLDSGAQATIGNPALYRLVAGRSTLLTQVSILSAGGQNIPAVVALAPPLRLGGLTVSHMPVAFADLHTFHMWDLGEQPVLVLGVDVLSHFQSVALDFARGEVRFRLPPSA
jgi:predicted aspartyl protease